MIRIRQSSRCIFAFGCMNVLICTLLQIHVLSNLELALAVSTSISSPTVPVAITLQHLLDSNDQHLDDTTHVLHFTCFRNDDDDHDADPDADADADSQSESVHVDVQSKGECCQQIIMATNEICSANVNVKTKTKTSAALFPIDLCRQLLSTDDDGIDGVDNDQKSDESLVQQQCSLYAAQVPVPESIHSSPPLHVHVPVFYFNLALEGRFSFNSRSHAAMPDDADANADANDDSSQSPTKSNSHPLVQYNNYSGTWAQYDPVKSPFQLEMALSDTTSTNDESPIISANLQSTISKEGGMHRAFRHLITLSTHNTPMHNHMHKQSQSQSQNNQGDGDGEGASASSLSNAINVNGEVVFAMPLSQGVFLDMEDPFQLQLDGDAHRACRFDVKKFKAVNDHDHDHDHDNGRSGGDEAESLGLGLCLVEIKTAPGTVVDIEQPAFVSPQHVIMLHVTFQLDHLVSLVESELELELELEVVMNLHFRYPTTTKNHALPKFVPVHVPTPFLHTCSVSIESQQSDTHEKVTAHSDTFTYLVSDRLDKKIDDSRWNDGAMVDVAAGVDAHHDPVMAVTLMVSFIGAWCMLRDMSTVSVWR